MPTTKSAASRYTTDALLWRPGPCRPTACTVTLTPPRRCFWKTRRSAAASQAVHDVVVADLLGLRLALQLEDFWVLKLPDGSKVEVFGPDSPVNRHFTTGPVAGFLVDDVFDATEELRSAGVEILLEPELDDSGNAWVHFRAPDGNIYEFTQDSGVTRPG
jgi:hypothetical protein